MHQHKPGQHESPTSGLLMEALTNKPSYAYLYNQVDEEVAPLAAVTFSNAGPSSQITAPPGSDFTVQKTGDYEFNFEVRGTPDTPSDALAFAIYVNGVLAAGTTFASEVVAGTALLVVGSGILPLVAGDSVTLHNVSPVNVSLLALVPGGETAINASMDLMQLSA
jgi:hypothetical protein